MADISRIKLPSGNSYDIKDSTARSMIAGGISFNIVWTATDYASSTAPDSTKLGDIPAGVTVYYNNGASSATGTLTASTDTKGKFYLIYSKTQSGTLDMFDEYATIETGASSLAWEKIGDTLIDLSNVVTGVTLNKETTNVVTGYASPTTDSVIGADATFTVTQPTITVTPTTTNIKATASGTAVGADGTAAAITGFGAHTTDTFVKSVSAETNKNLVTTSVPNVTENISVSIPNVTGNTSVSIPNVTGNTTVTANKSTWTFTMGSGDDAETLVIGGGNGSDVTATNTTLGTNLTATNTTLGTNLTATNTTLGTAITCATGETSTTGTGDAVVTGVTIGSSAAAITALGTPTTSNCLTGVKVTTQPTVALATGATAGSGVISVATGITSASASGGNVAWNSKDAVTALTGLGSASTESVLNNSTTITVTKGS